MSAKDTTVRVKTHTKELILKHSRKRKISQNDLIEQAILCAEQHNFSTEIPLKQIEKNQTIQANRIIGFLKTQDKNLSQIEDNIYNMMLSKLKADRNEVLEFVHYQTIEELPKAISDFYIEEENLEILEARDLGIKYTSIFKKVSSDIYGILRKNILTLK